MILSDIANFVNVICMPIWEFFYNCQWLIYHHTYTAALMQAKYLFPNNVFHTHQY